MALLLIAVFRPRPYHGCQNSAHDFGATLASVLARAPTCAEPSSMLRTKAEHSAQLLVEGQALSSRAKQLWVTPSQAIAALALQRALSQGVSVVGVRLNADLRYTDPCQVA